MLNGSGSLPIAVAGADVTVAEATPPLVVVLDGSGSSDVDGTITSYHWTAPAGVTLTNANTAVASYTAVDDAAFVATLEVCDDDAQCDTDAVNVTVTNVAPSPNSGADQTASAGAPVLDHRFVQRSRYDRTRTRRRWTGVTAAASWMSVP